MAEKFCFVISPIGAEGSDIRAHADTVFECLIKPACEGSFGKRKSHYVVERGDHKTAPGKITDQIYDDILRAELIIAVLTGSNPNVYYELAIAQAAAKPVILLLEKGVDPPFDVKDQRIIYYDFDPRAIFHGTYTKQLEAAIEALEERRVKPSVPFAPHLTPLGDPVQSIGDRASEGESDSVRIVAQARKFVWMMGYSMQGWTVNEDFERAMLESAPLLSKDVRICLLSAKNPSFAASMKNPEIAESAATQLRTAPESWRSLKRKLPKTVTFEIRQNVTNCIGYQVVMNEDEAIIIPYLTSRETVRSPYIHTKSGSATYDAIKEEFLHVWPTKSVHAPRKGVTAKPKKR